MTRISLVCIEDDPKDREAVRLQIEDLIDNPITYLSTAEEFLFRLDQGTMTHPGIVLVDVDLPGMSGYELVKIIREKYKYLDRTQLVMLSNDRRPIAMDTARAVGAGGYIIKPLTVFSFLDVVRRLKPRRFRMEIHDRGVDA